MFKGRRLCDWKGDRFATRGGHIFEICSRSVGELIFHELINGNESGCYYSSFIDGDSMVTMKEYKFKDIMERFMTTGAAKIVSMRKKHHKTCYTMKQWFNFMDLMSVKKDKVVNIVKYTVTKRWTANCLVVHCIVVIVHS